MDAGHAQLRHIREDSADGDKHSLNKRKLQVFFAVGDGLQGLPDDGERRGGQDQRRQAREGIHDVIPRPVVGLTVFRQAVLPLERGDSPRRLRAVNAVGDHGGQLSSGLGENSKHGLEAQDRRAQIVQRRTPHDTTSASCIPSERVMPGNCTNRVVLSNRGAGGAKAPAGVASSSRV